MDIQLSDASYAAFSTFLHKNVGIVLGSNRQYLVRSRLTVLARNQQYESLDLFLKDVVTLKNRDVTNQCLELMTTNETFWFRDAYPFTLLSSHILPSLQNNPAKRTNKLRIWSSACASGQEPYSIAMTLADFLRDNPSAFSAGIEIVASDFSTSMINIARAGIYDELALGRGLSDHYRHRYFAPVTHEQSQKMQLVSNIRNMISFTRLNLLSDFSSLGTFDIIFCRNVLIYFDGNQKADILNKFAARLPESGALLLGAAESITGAESKYKMQSPSAGLYYTKR